jgi:UDP:flavonoid glycosyltransferase YjiC (YdhE family)
MRIALATVGTTGDVRPFAHLARALVDRGHTVSWTTVPCSRERPSSYITVAPERRTPSWRPACRRSSCPRSARRRTRQGAAGRLLGSRLADDVLATAADQDARAAAHALGAAIAAEDGIGASVALLERAAPEG